MKTIFRFLSLGTVLTAFVALGAPESYAQEACADVDGQTATYTKFTELYPKTAIADREATIEAGKQFLEKYGSCDSVKEQADYLKGAIPKLEETLKKIKEGIERKKLFDRFDAGINTDNADEIYAAGKEILAKQSDNIHVLIPLGIVGLRESYNKNNKYADDAIKYGRTALNDLKAGKPCEKFDQKTKAMIQECGALKYQFKREDVVNELTYAIGYLTFYAKNDKKAALPIYYEISQGTSKYKNEPRVYATIGSYFAGEIPRLTGEVGKLIDKQKGLPTDEEKIKMEPEIKAAIALLNGYAERAMDGFIRAYNTAKSSTPAEKAYRDGIYKDLTVLYQGRFEKKDGLDPYILKIAANPMPNPSSEVTPVSDPEPATTTAKPATTGQPAKAAPATAITKPVSDAKPKASTPAKTPSATTVAVKTKPVSKKPVAKKKGKV